MSSYATNTLNGPLPNAAPNIRLYDPGPTGQKRDPGPDNSSAIALSKIAGIRRVVGDDQLFALRIMRN